MKHLFRNTILGLIAISFGMSGCQKGDLLSNPNVLSSTATAPLSLIVNHITANMLKEEEPVISTCYRLNQFITSNYSYYFGSNAYNFTNTGDTYDNIKYCVLLEQQAQKQLNNTNNFYFAFSKFIKAYNYIWLTQRVGDIPMSQSNSTDILTPSYDTQHDVYKRSLALLDSANTIFNSIIGAANKNSVADAGDIYGLTFTQWQKLVNTYKLRVLISLSKRATDNADLNIKTQFATIINNPTQYPIFGSNADNLVYKYTAITIYPPNRAGYAPYNNCENINTTFFNVTVPNNDPRIYALTTPALLSIRQGKQVSDSSAYIGQSNNLTQNQMSAFTADSAHSCLSWNRYMSSSTGANAEPYIIVGYPEMCFNIAEAINLGWVTGNSAQWYTNGIKASLALYGIPASGIYSTAIGNYDGTNKNIGTATCSVDNFLTRVAYAGDNATGLTQILTQKYIAFFMNSGYEAFYNWRRTGVPTFNTGGPGVGTPSNSIALRWMYPQNEISYNSTNYNAALTSQGYSGDDIFAKMWLIK